MTVLQEKPKLRLPITRFEKVLNILACICFISVLIYALYYWQKLPNKFPAHYDIRGEVDRWGKKWEMFFLPVITAILWIGMTILEKYPHLYNYTNITKENVVCQYINARMMINVMKNVMTFFFVYILWHDVQVAMGTVSGLGPWFAPIFIFCLFAPMIYFIIRSLQLRK